MVNRGSARGEEMAGLLNARTKAKTDYVAWQGRFRVPGGTDIVINATLIGLFPKVEETLNLDTETLMQSMVVADGIHNPPLTRLLKAAQARGCRTVDGLGMLVGQGVIGIKYWTGIDADPAVMRRALLDLEL